MSDGQATGQDEVEVAHEALIRHWPRLRAWLDEDRAGLLLRESIREAAQEWEQHGRDESYLAHRGRRLAEAEALALHPRFALNAQEQAYLDAAVALRRREEEEREAQRQRELAAQKERAELAEAAQHEAEQRVAEQAVAAERLRKRLLVAAAFGLLALLAAAGAFWAFQQANEQRGIAQQQSAAAGAAAQTAEAEVVVRSTAEARALTNERLATEREAEAAAARDAEATARADAEANAEHALLAQEAADAAAFQAGRERNRAVNAQATAEAEAARSRVQAMAALAPRQHDLGQDERGLLLARQAYLFDEKMGWTAQAQVDDGLRATLGAPAFSRILHGGGAPVLSVAVSPDGRFLAAGSGQVSPTASSYVEDNVMRLWDLHQQADNPVVLPHPAPVWTVAFSPDGQKLASLDLNGTVRLWDPENPNEPTTVADAAGARTIAFGPVGQILAFSRCGEQDASGSMCPDAEVRVLDLDQPGAPLHSLRGHTGIIWSLAFAPDGAMLATGGDDGTLRLWNLDEPEPEAVVHRTDQAGADEGRITSVAFQPDGQAVAAGSGDGVVRVWQVDQPDEPPIALMGSGGVLSLAFSPTGPTLAAGSRDTSIRIWDLAQPTTDPVVLSAPNGWPTSLAFDPEGATLVSGYGDSTTRLWRLDQPDAMGTAIADLGGEVDWLAFGPDDAMLAAGSCVDAGNRDFCETTGVSIVALDPADPSEVVPTVLAASDGFSVPVAAFDPGGRFLATGGDDGVQLWDMSDPTTPRSLPESMGDAKALAFDPERLTLAAATDYDIRVWNPRDPQRSPTVIPLDYVAGGEVIPVNVMAVDPAVERLAVGLNDGTVEIWSLPTPGDEAASSADEPERFTLAGGDSEIRALAFSPDGVRLASGDASGTVRVWYQPRSGSAPASTLRAQGAAILALAFAADGDVLASGGTDRTVRLWRMRQPRAAPAILGGHARSVSAVAFSANGQTIATADLDGVVRIWSTTEALADAVCARVGRIYRWRSGASSWGTPTPSPTSEPVPICARARARQPRRRSPALSDRLPLARPDQDLPVPLHDVERLEIDLGRTLGHLAAAQVEARAMPRALDLAVDQPSFGERPEAVGTELLHGENLSIQPRNRHHRAVHLDPQRLAVGQSGGIRDRDKAVRALPAAGHERPLRGRRHPPVAPDGDAIVIDERPAQVAGD
jgi:WD40 repeat protein